MTTTGATSRQPSAGAAGAATAGGVLAMAFVGGSVAVSGLLADAALATAQSLRYAAASLLLLALAAVTGRRVRRPRREDWPWLLGTTLTGLVLFNVALVRGAEHAEPAALAVAVACVPIVLALAGPLVGGPRPGPRLLGAAVLVTGGAVLVQGVGRTSLLGAGWALVVLLCEVGFTLLAVPLLARHGAWGVSVHTTWIAAVAFGVWALLGDGPAAVTRLDAAHLAAVAYLAVLVTAVAFVLWYSCVHRIGVGRAGLLSGTAPVAAAAVGALLGAGVPSAGVWLGTLLVGAGLAVGLSPRRTGRSRPGAPPPR